MVHIQKVFKKQTHIEFSLQTKDKQINKAGCPSNWEGRCQMRDALTCILLVAQCSLPPEYSSCSFWGLYLPMTDPEVFTFSNVCIFYSLRCCRLLHVYIGDALLCEMLSPKLSIFTALTNEAWYLQIFIAKSSIEKNLLSFKKVSAFDACNTKMNSM